ncbi:MAG: M1 family aminopeptidase [Phycisphaerae bacterium]
MTSHRPTESTAALVVATVLVAVAGPTGCATVPRLAVQAQRYRIEVGMDPVSHRLVGHTVLDVVRVDDQPFPAGQPVAVELLLHPDLRITQVAASGTDGRYGRARREAPSEEDDFAPRKHLVVLDEPVDAFTLFVDYEGELFQDVSAGEKLGEIHNFAMRAHIGKEGIYLADGYWYPQIAAEDDAAEGLAEYVLITDPVPNLQLVAGAERDPAASEKTGRLVWHSPYPLDGMVLVGGPHEIHRATHNGIAISVHLQPSQARHAEGLIDTVRRNLDRYEPLVGPYPAAEYSIVDNFFSSGFAFPTFTLLSSAVINMGKRSQTMHGFIDHEMLHCWWGNGVHVDPSDGNWCEALTSYCTNYYGYVLDGNQEDARRKRRNYCQSLSRIQPEDDKPLGTFDRDDGCGRGIAYHKGAMVFHMLARKMGQENFWAAMRQFTKEYVGAYASWDDIRRVCEQAGGMSLEAFFHQWVRGSGAPMLSIEEARYHSADQTLTLSLSQGESAFDLNVPVRVVHAGGTLDIEVPLRGTIEEVTVPVSVVPLSIEVDPDYHIFRKVSLGDIIPTTAATRHGSAFACVLPSGEVPGQYKTLQEIFERSFDDEGDERIVRTVGSIEGGALAEHCVLILGEAVRDPYVGAFLSASEFPVRFMDEGFEFDGVEYTDEGDAVLCTIRHPDMEGGGVTVVYANSEAAIPPARNIPMYDRSAVIFKDRRAVLRKDFEHRHVVRVER